ncbi:MAG: hypothetical protein IPO04_20105 [Cytophagaceae bacterium]|nr:hypothetical protein [Cytophagaceae bacterium]
MSIASTRFAVKALPIPLMIGWSVTVSATTENGCTFGTSTCSNVPATTEKQTPGNT